MLTICTGLLVLYMVRKNIWLLRGAVIIGIGGVVSDVFSKKVEYLWHKLAWLLGLLVPNLILSLVYFLFVCPLSWLRRLFSREDLLMLDNNRKSTYIVTNKAFKPESFEQQW